MDTITAREANQQFSRILSAVADGQEFVVTRNGVPVARISPERTDGRRHLSEPQRRILERSRQRLIGGSPAAEGGVDRTRLYDEVLGVEPAA